MKRIVAAAAFAAAAFVGPSAGAATLSFPSDEPVASITIPDDWGPKETDSGIDAMSADEAVYLAIDVADSESVEQVVTDAVTYLSGAGVTVDTATQKEGSAEFNGLKASTLEWEGTDKDGPVTIGLAFTSPKEGKLLVLTYWGSKGDQDAHGAEIGAILGSIKPAP